MKIIAVPVDVHIIPFPFKDDDHGPSDETCLGRDRLPAG